jgi:GT2 family glycosyltransferase
LLKSVVDVVVVDNASTDRTDELVRKSGARLIRRDDNAGFAAACNVGIREARSRYVLIVNPDAWPLGDAVSLLVTCAKRNSRAAVIAPGLVNANGSHQRSVFGYPQTALSVAAFAAVPRFISGVYRVVRGIRNGVLPHRRPGSEGGAASIDAREFVSGAALLLKADVVRQLGGFDERFFFFSEEADLCFRAREAGWLVLYCPDARFVHVGASSSPASRDWRYAELLRSYLLLQAKRNGLPRAQLARRLLVAVLSGRAVLATGERRRRYKSAIDRLRAEDVLSPTR